MHEPSRKEGKKKIYICPEISQKRREERVPFTRQLFQISKLFESRTKEKEANKRERERERRSVPRRHEEEQERKREGGRPETNDNAEDIVLKSGAT